MRMRRFFVGLLVLGLAVGMLGMVGFAKKHSANADDRVTWTIQEYIELTIDDSSYDFGTIDAGVDTVSDDEANTLFVRSNTDWELKYSVAGAGSDHLQVALDSEDGTGDAKISVGYSLSSLRAMEPGDYSVTVTYTVTAK